jgi:hypothetical protein
VAKIALNIVFKLKRFSHKLAPLLPGIAFMHLAMGGWVQGLGFGIQGLEFSGLVV